VSRMRENLMSGSTGGSWRRSEPRPPKPAALGKPRDLSTATPTDHHLASSLPNQTPSSRRSRPRRCPYRLPDPPTPRTSPTRASRAAPEPLEAVVYLACHP
jgi:hypothetical protein